MRPVWLSRLAFAWAAFGDFLKPADGISRRLTSPAKGGYKTAVRIRTQLALTLSGVAAFSFFVAWLVASSVSDHLVRTMLAQQQQRQAGAIGSVAEVALALKAQPVLAQFLRTIPAVIPTVEFAYVEGKDGKILAHSDPASERLSAAFWTALHPSASDFRGAVRSGGEIVGTAHVGSSGMGVSGIGSILLPSILASSSLGVLLSLVMGFGISVIVSRPIATIAAAAQKVGRGDLSVELPVESEDELGELAAEFNRMVGQLRLIDQLKDDFIASVSHDLRSPLAGIRMSLDFMLKEDPNRERLLPKQRRTLTNIAESTTRLGVFISNILDAAKMKAERMEYHPQPVALAPLIDGLLELYAALATNKGITLKADFPGQALAAQADPERLERVINNLLSNALKFTPKGGTVTLAAKPVEQDVEFSVSDTGRGISPEALPKLFQRFGQVDVAGQKAAGVQGTGLGLFIVKQTIEGMGGTIGIDSQLGAGTRVHFRLPKAARTPQPGAAASTGPISAKVLVVDDEYFFSSMTQQLLESRGFEAIVADDGRNAVESASKEKPDLILLETNVGMDILKALRQNPATSSMPVILCSATQEFSPETLRAVGAASFLLKPIQAEALDRCIRQVLATLRTH